MMFIIPIVVTCDSSADLPLITEAIRDKTSADIIYKIEGMGNILPVPVESEDDFRKQLQQ